LATRTLWPDDFPTPMRNAWTSFQTVLLTENPDWKVWIDWYEARLAGLAHNPKFETARVTIPDHIWDNGARAVNAQILRATDALSPKEGIPTQQPPAVPAQQPAAIEPIWQRGRLTVSKSHAATGLGKKGFTSALLGLREELGDFASAIAEEGNVDRRFV